MHCCTFIEIGIAAIIPDMQLADAPSILAEWDVMSQVRDGHGENSIIPALSMPSSLFLHLAFLTSIKDRAWNFHLKCIISSIPLVAVQKHD